MIGMGADMFDCVMPSRAARHGMAYTSTGTLNLRNEKFKEDYSPLDENSDCPASREFSKSYLRHLIQAKESLAGTILTLHNLRFFVSLMEEARKQILKGEFERWSDRWICSYNSGA
jgi:queuine tRNA-ribosyltransferase